MGGKNMESITVVVLDELGNGEGLDKCIESIKKQSYRAVEILVISTNKNANVLDVTNVYLAKNKWSLEELVALTYHQAKGDWVTFMQSKDFILQDDALVKCMQELAVRDVDMGVANLITLDSGQFTFIWHSKSMSGLVTTNNILPYMRVFKSFQNIWGLFLKKTLLEKLVAQDLKDSKQELLYQAVHLATKALIMNSHFYCWVADGKDKWPKFKWQENYHYSNVNQLVTKLKNSNYQEIIPKRIAVAVCIDDNLAKRIVPLIYSIAKNNQNVDIYIVYYYLRTTNLDYLRMINDKLPNVELKFYKISKELHQLIEPIDVSKSNVPVAAYNRVLLPYVLTDLERVIYLDADTVIVDDLKPLWQIKLAGNYIGAVKDILVYANLRFSRYHPMFGAQGDDYFNSGVLLMDLKAMRQENMPIAIINAAVDVATVSTYADQDTLNVYYHNAYKQIDVKYNYGTFFLDYIPKKVSELSIIHYCTGGKPWENLAHSHLYEQTMELIHTYRKYRNEFNGKLALYPHKISVIIKLGEASWKEIARCLESFFIQTYSNLEFILLVNESPSEEITSYFEALQKFYDLKVLKNNLVTAIEQAQGEYLYFFNATDALADETSLDKFYQAIHKDKDLVTSDYQGFITKNHESYFSNDWGKVKYLKNIKDFELCEKRLDQLMGLLVSKNLVEEILNY